MDVPETDGDGLGLGGELTELDGVVEEPDGETLGLEAGALLFGDPTAGVVGADVPVPDVPVPDVPVPVPEVPLPDVLEPELADPVPDGDGLGEGLLVGAGVEGAVLDEAGCGAAGDVDAGVVTGCADCEGEGCVEAVAVAGVEPEGAHDGIGADLSAIVGTSSGLMVPGLGGVQSLLVGAAAACAPLPPPAGAPELVAR